MSNKKDGLTELLVSGKPEMINSRFRVKASIFNNGVHPKSTLIVVEDLLESGFSMKFFTKQEDAAALLKLLHAASS
jgi:hypothetical protein